MPAKRLTQRRTRLEKNFTAVFSDMLSGMTQPEIAAKYGVGPSAVAHFKSRNAEALQQAMAETAYRSREVDIANKTYRISELGDLYGTAKAEITTAESTTERLAAINTASARLRQVAEELGALPRPDQNINIKAAVLVRQLEGAQLDDIG